MLRRLEALGFFSAMMLAIVLEGMFVYRILEHPLLRPSPHSSFSLAGEWTGPVLPQGWLLGALLMLVYRVTVLFITPAPWTDNESWCNRRAFVRLWRWTVALIAV